MRMVNPWVIPRNHRIESVIAAAERGDFAPFEDLSQALASPYEEPVRNRPVFEPAASRRAGDADVLRD